MKTAVYQINSKYVHSSLAVWYLAQAVRNSGCECTVLEGSINESITALVQRAVGAEADAVAFSCYIWNIDTVLACARELKRSCGCTVILGGPEVGYRAQDILESCPFVDYVISGEGEVPLSVLACALRDGKSVPAADGISMREGEGYRISAPYQMTEDPPCPYSEEYLSRLGGRISYIETSRGCPFSCAYCLSCTQGVRFFDTERAKRDIMTLAGSGSKTVKFVDRTFNADRARACELFSFIIDKHTAGDIPDGVTFHFEIAGELVDEESMTILKNAPAGLFQLEIGVQSFNRDTLRAIHRYTDTDRLQRVISELSGVGNIHIHTDLIAGLPYEGLDSFRHSYNTLASLSPHKIQLGFLKLLHGADMREHAELYPCEYENNPPYTVISTPWLSESDMEVLRYVERANDGIFYSGRFNRTVEYLLEATGEDRFSLAYTLGRILYNTPSIPLDELFDSLFAAASGMSGVDRGVLRDVMLYDRISHNNSCVIPRSLRVSDPRMKKISERTELIRPMKKGVRRCIGIMYTEGTVIFADYDSKHPVSGLYEVHTLDMHGLCEGSGGEN